MPDTISAGEIAIDCEVDSDEEGDIEGDVDGDIVTDSRNRSDPDPSEPASSNPRAAPRVLTWPSSVSSKEGLSIEMV